MKKAILLFILCTLCYLIQAQQDLRLNLQSGTIYHANTITERMIIQHLEGIDDKTTSTEIAKMTFEVIKDLDSLYVFEVKFISLSSRTENNGKVVFASSETNDSSNILSSIAKLLVNQPFEISMYKNGSLREAKKIENILEALFDKYSMATDQKMLLLAQLKQSFNALISEDNSFTAFYPSKKVRVEEEWLINAQSNSAFKLITNTAYKLKRKTKDELILNGKGVAASGQEEFISNGLPMVFHLKGNTESNIRLNNDSRWIKDAQISCELKGTVEIKEPALFESLFIPMTIIIKSSVSGY